MIEYLATVIVGGIIGSLITYTYVDRSYIRSKLNRYVFNDNSYKISISPNRELENYITEYASGKVENQYINRHKDSFSIREIKITTDDWAVEFDVHEEEDK